MNQPSQWTTGKQVIYREIWRGKVWTARPVTLVQDTPDLVVLYLCSGTHWKLPAGNRELFLSFLQAGIWQLRDVVSHEDILFLIHPETAYATHLIWKPENRQLLGWYINLQAPLRRTTIGFDFMDQVLDIWVKPDLSEWAWKDENDLQHAQEMGLFSEAQIREIRAEGERVIELIQTRTGLFSQEWEHWAPPAEWSVPHLAEGWDKF